MRDELAATFFTIFPTEQEGSSAKAAAWLESLARVIRVDIADVECVHSTIREFTKQRGRGHIPPLTVVGAKVLCRWVAAKHQGVTTEKNHKDTEAAEESAVQQQRGAGGTWRAFCSERFANQKMSRNSLKDASEAYHNLSHDEYQYFKEMGLRMTLGAQYKRLQGQHGNSTPTANRPGPGSLLQATNANSREILEMATSAKLLQLMILGLDSSSEGKYKHFGRILWAERRDLRKTLIEKDKTAIECVRAALSSDRVLSELVMRHGGPALLEGLQHMPLTNQVDLYEWKMPLGSFTEAGASANCITLHCDTQILKTQDSI